MLLEDVEDVFADLCELALDLLSIGPDHGDLGLVALGLFLLLDGRDDAPAGTTGSDYVLVSYGEQVALFDGQLLIRRRDALHVLDHFWGATVRIVQDNDGNTYLHSAQPVRRALRGRQSLHGTSNGVIRSVNAQLEPAREQD